MFSYGFPKHWSTLKKLLWLKLLQGAAAVVETITGTLPLTLANALSHAIVSLTRYGLCVQDGTPTPDAPVDIMCNNGALMVSPNLANVVEANVVVGQYINNSGVETADIANFFYAPYIAVTPGGTYTMATSSSIWYFSVMQYDSSKNFLRRTIWGATNTPVGTEKTFGVGADCAYIRFGSNMKKASISLADVLAVNWMLTQTATAQDFRPYGEIYAGGTHPGQNLVDLTAVTDGYYYDQNGVYTAAEDARLSDFIPVKAGQKYTAYVANLGSRFAFNVRVNLFSTDRVWLSQSATPVTQPSVIVITPTEDGYLRLSANYKGTSSTSSWADWSTLQIVRGEYTLSTMPPYEPYEEIPYQPEVLTVSGKNLFDKDNMPAPIYTAYISNVSGEGRTRLISGTSERTVLMPIEPNTTYTVTKVYTDRLRIAEFSTIPNISPETSGTLLASDTSNEQRTNRTITTGATAAYLAIQINNVRIESQSTTLDAVLASLQVEEGSTATDYEPYVAPQTVSVPMLLGVGNYKDEVELIRGIKTGKVGVKVFDGTEDWAAFTSSIVIQNATSAWGAVAGGGGYCTHLTVLKAGETTFAGSCRFATAFNLYEYKTAFDVADVDGFKAKIAALYAAGTPVILVYPLATETTEQTTAQHLVTNEGTNIVDSVANVGPVEAKVEYMKAA